ncbi:unnamed protein product [Vicia faba]|uniref:Uncharacterized protein n=1 Tax=Vicia faba TaxID=3906 RepID=A0AAV0ZMD7_VICFA|nr:unnamed protein product [Vicia faba]
MDKETLVSEFIDNDLCCWDQVRIRNCFSPMEANNIMSIPLSWRLPEDRLIWMAGKNGAYSVRTTYPSLRAKKISKAPGPSCQMFQRLWKHVWSAPVNNRIRNCLGKEQIFPMVVRSVMRTKKPLNICSSNVTPQKMVWFSSPLDLHIPPNPGVMYWLDH